MCELFSAGALRRCAAPPFASQQLAQCDDNSPHDENQQNEDENRDGEGQIRVTPDEDADARDGAELRHVDDAVGDRLGRRVNSIAQSEFGPMRRKCQTASEQSSGDQENRIQIVAVATARSAAAGGRITLCAVSHTLATPGMSVTRNSTA